MPHPMLPSELELTIDPKGSIRNQVEEGLKAQRKKYAWFRALTDEQLGRLADRLANLAAYQLAGHQTRLESMAEAGLIDARDAERMSKGLRVAFSPEQLQQCCEALLPMVQLQKKLLEELDLRHIFGDAQEDQRRAKYAAKIKAAYDRTPLIQAHDPKGELFMLDLLDTLGHSQGERVNALDFVAFGCHGTAAASLRHMEGRKQLLNIIWRGIAGRQKEVGEQVVQWVERKANGSAKNKPFGFLLGDNFYESGIPRVSNDVVDQIFSKAFEEIYQPSTDKGVRGATTYFAALGNHDYNFHGHAVLPEDGSQFASNLDRALAQVEYTYRSSLGGWVLPYRYYCLVSPIANFFVIDSSTFLFDKKQQDWLKQAYAKIGRSNRWNFLMSHHGFVTFGSRGSGHYASKDIRGLTKTSFTKKALRERGRTGAGETEALAAAATGLRENVNRYLFAWIVNEGMHFHFNVVAHDHFMASALLTYDMPGKGLRRTYFVLSGGGGASSGGANLDTLVALGPNLANIDFLEKKYGFATFSVSQDQVELNFRIVEKKQSHDAWETSRKFRLSDGEFWMPPRNDGHYKQKAQPVLRGVFYKRGEGGLFHSSAYRRRYFEIEYGKSIFRYGEKPGKLVNSIDLRHAVFSSRSWRPKAEPARSVTIDGVEGLLELSFRTTQPKRTWVFAAPPEIFADLALWLEEGMKANGAGG